MNRRSRNLVLLGAAALVSVALAGFALSRRAAEGAPKFVSSEFLPGFAAHVKDAARIHIAAHRSAFDIVYSKNRGWVLPDRGNYPADLDEVRHTLIGLAALETIAPKTARPDWLHYLALDAPPAGGGTRITVRDAAGHVLADLITGNMEELGDPSGAAGLFVRRPDESQSYLARAVFVPHGEIGAWLLAHILQLDAARIRSVAMTPASGPPYTIARSHPSDPDYALSPLAKGKTANPEAVDALPAALTDFTIADVRPASAVDFAAPNRLVVQTFDGLALTIDVIQQGTEIWARLSAQAGAGGSPAVAQEAEAINSRSAGWAYKLAIDKGRPLMTTLDSLVQASPNGMGGGG